ncbi:S24 family peptidase [Pseudomonas asiatica]|uniref:S24 family peptidase n=1 Tax=Pseudomonas asiatica TaxID=2219225 RepID=UPI00207B35C6|nr:LexA family transcriptional regulator [Pseudomonas asiatica]
MHCFTPNVGSPTKEWSERLENAVQAHSVSPLPEGSDEEELDGKYAYVPQYDAKAAAGLGSENPHVEIRSTLAFKREWLRVKGAKPDQLIVIYAEGESMWPTINDGDVLLVDRSRIEPADGQVFVLAGSEGAIVKRLIQGPLGSGAAQRQRRQRRVPGSISSAQQRKRASDHRQGYLARR